MRLELLKILVVMQHPANVSSSLIGPSRIELQVRHARALVLPNGTIIDARRQPMACCFSNFKQLFASGQEFTYSLRDIGRYYRCYVGLMDHWTSVLPGKFLRVQHEEVLQDLEGQVRRIFDFTGLAFEAACLEFYKTDRSVRTASSEF